MGINKVFLSGRLGADPVLRPTAKEGSMLVMRLACHIFDSTQWYTLFAFSKTAEFISKYAQKGQELFIEGRLSSKMYKDVNGETREGIVVIVASVELGRMPQTVQPLSSADKIEFEINSKLIDTEQNSSSAFEPV